MRNGVEISEGQMDAFLEGLRNYPYEYTLSLDDPECLGPSMDWEIGSKALHLAEMRQAGLPVLPGFAITSSVGRQYKGLSIVEFHQNLDLQKEIMQRMILMAVDSWGFFKDSQIEGYWSDKQPQLVAVRSGSMYSMPGMLGTIVNVGINDTRVPTLTEQMGSQCVQDCYLNFASTFLETLFDINAEHLRDDLFGDYGILTSETELNNLKAWYKSRTRNVKKKDSKGLDLSMTPEEALFMSIWAVFHSWEARRARVYRQRAGIPDEAWTAVTVLPMVFGNLNEQSGSGVLYTHDPETGKLGMKCSYARGKQGVSVVGGTLDPRELDSLPEEVREQLHEYGYKLVEMYGCGQDIEFTVQDGQLILLQTRNQRLSGVPQLTMIDDLYTRRLTSNEKIPLLVPQQILDRLGTRIKSEAFNRAVTIGHGDGLGGGAIVGYAATSNEAVQNILQTGGKPILIVEHLDPHESLEGVSGVITKLGDATSHAGNRIISLGIPAVFGCQELTYSRELNEFMFGGRKLKDGEFLTADGLTGAVYVGLKPEDLELIKIPEELKAIQTLRQEQIGGDSRFTDAVVAMGLGATVREKTEAIRELLDEARSRWQSQKAIAQEVLNQVFPPDMMIKYDIIKSDSFEEVQRIAKQIWLEGFDASLRSAYDPPVMGKNPWLNLPTESNGLWEGFVAGDSTLNLYGSIKDWQVKGNLTELLVGRIPKDTLNSTLAGEHFVWTVHFSPEKGIVTRVIPGTPQLRAFEELDHLARFELRTQVVPGLSEQVGNIQRVFPRTFLNLAEFNKIGDRNEWRGQYTQMVYELFSRIHDLPVKIAENDVESYARLFGDTALQLVEEGLLTRDEEELLIQPPALAVARHIEEEVFRKMWRPIVIGMAAMENVLGPLTLEGQGRINPADNSLAWLKIYGIKGLEERVGSKNHNH